MANRWPLVALAALAGCSTGFEDPSLVKDLRVLAMKAAPPEVIFRDPGDIATPIVFTTLLADPGQAGRTLHCVLQTCVLDTRERRCLDPSTTTRLAEFDCRDGENPVSVTIPGPVLLAVQKQQAGWPAYDPGTPVYVELVVTGGKTELHAVKDVVFSPPTPAGRVANSNPVIASVSVDGTAVAVAVDGTVALPLPATGKVRLEIVPADGSEEDYVVPTYTGDTRHLKELNRLAYYSDTAAFSSQSRSDTSSDTQKQDGPPDLWSDWTVPKPAGAGEPRFWFVALDGRGGVAWATGTKAD